MFGLGLSQPTLTRAPTTVCNRYTASHRPPQDLTFMMSDAFMWNFLELFSASPTNGRFCARKRPRVQNTVS